MANIKVNELTQSQTIASTDRFVILTDDANNVVETIATGDFLGDIISEDSDNLLSTGTDNKLFAELNNTGVVAGSYTTPNVVVNAKGQITSITSSSVSIDAGFFMWYCGETAPTGYLICDGSAISRDDYSALFEAIGTTYGLGDGSTTFNLPNLIDKFAQGSMTVGTIKDAGLPQIEGALNGMQVTEGFNVTGAFSIPSRYNLAFYSDGTAYRGANARIDASRSNPIYGNSNTVQPPALTLLPCIKY